MTDPDYRKMAEEICEQWYSNQKDNELSIVDLEPKISQALSQAYRDGWNDGLKEATKLDICYPCSDMVHELRKPEGMDK